MVFIALKSSPDRCKVDKKKVEKLHMWTMNIWRTYTLRFTHFMASMNTAAAATTFLFLFFFSFDWFLWYAWSVSDSNGWYRLVSAMIIHHFFWSLIWFDLVSHVFFFSSVGFGFVYIFLRFYLLFRFFSIKFICFINNILMGSLFFAPHLLTWIWVINRFW